VTIRLASVRDEPAVLTLYKTCHPTWTERPGRFYTDNTTLVAVEGEEIIGYAVLGFEANGAHAILHDSGVHPTKRGKGIAWKLHEERLELATKRGAEFAVGFTWAENEVMLSLLERLGFVQTLTHPNFFSENDPPADGLVFVKRLRPAAVQDPHPQPSTTR
jgi:ribosomal protein S18 acetylase RimI-like enzyme